MALLDLKPTNDAVMEVLHPLTGEVMACDKGKPYTLTLIGADSDKYQAMLKRGLEKSYAKKGKKVDLDDASRRGIEMLAKCVTDCRVEIEAGKFVENSFEELVKVFTEYKWLKEQAEAFIADRANFIKG